MYSEPRPQWHIDGMTCVAKYQGLRASGPPASELKALINLLSFLESRPKIYLSANFNCLEIFILFSILNGNFKCVLSLIYLIHRPACNEMPLDT
jgi:hypothetical protein